MSGWDSYIDNVVAQSSNQCDKVCIIGLDGSQYTSNEHSNALKLTPQEISTLTRVLGSARSDPQEFMTNGIRAEGIKYTFLRTQDDMVLGKKKDHGAITCQIANKCIVIGHTKEGGQHGNVNKGVATVATHLKEQGF